MAKTFWGLSGAVCAMIAVAALMVTVIATPAHAQTGWEATTPDAESGAKKPPPPPPPPPLQIAGSWAGNLVDFEQGPGTINFVFTETKINKKKSRIKGTWSVTFPHTAPSGGFTDVGKVAGSVTGTTLAITMRRQRGDRATCNLLFKSTTASQEQISGIFAFAACGAPSSKRGPLSIAPAP
jgi:hypothetical protein